MRKTLWIPIAAIAAIGLLSGCTLADQLLDTSGFQMLDDVRTKGAEIEDRALDAAATSVDKYCLVPAILRAWLRTEINSRTEVAEIVVICPGDSA